MLEKPAIEDASILAALWNDFNLAARQIEFLPLGADLNTAVYRATTAAGVAYFVKLRTGAFDEITVTLPAYLASQGIRQIIPPLAAQNGRRWAAFDAGALIVYPFVTAHNGYEIELSAQHWALHYLRSNFQASGTIERAFAASRLIPGNVPATGD